MLSSKATSCIGGRAATTVATSPPKKGRHRLIGVGTKWTIAHLSVRSNSKIERDLRPTGYCVVGDVTKTLFGVPRSERSTGIVQRFGCDGGVSGYLQPPLSHARRTKAKY